MGDLLPAQSLDETHRRCRQVSAAIAATGATLLLLGGGHDFAAPGFLGFVDGHPSRLERSKPHFGLINVDPHLDVRELEEGLPHSGTPFRQVLDSKELRGEHFVEFGARANRNARSHYEFCRKNRVTVTTLESLRAKRTSVAHQFGLALGRLARAVPILGVTFDMDSCAEAEGMSAAPVVGFSAAELPDGGPRRTPTESALLRDRGGRSPTRTK